MKIAFNILVLLVLMGRGASASAQPPEREKEPTPYKKRVLEAAEVDLLFSYYEQEGDHAAVGGGIGTEELTDITPTFVVSIPLNEDSYITADFGISAYTSASSSNINPFSSGASKGYEDDDEDEYDGPQDAAPAGTPWLEASGASRSDVLGHATFAYTKYSDDRNRIWSANVAFSNEFDYTSIGLGGSYTWLFNQKNTEVSIKGQAYLDQWRAIYPTELDAYNEERGNLDAGFFEGVNILNRNGDITDKNYGPTYWPTQFGEWDDEGRNSYSLSVSLSQILSQRLQVSLFADVVMQDGLLSTPYHRIYFADKENYYIGDARHIDHYDTPQNTGVFQLADDVERLPDSRLKIPVGARLNYYINEFMVLRTYYRYYYDDWGITGNTASIELPMKVGASFTFYPTYRYYNQSAVDYFAPYETHLSTEEYYTSDYDLSGFHSNQYGVGIRYTDIFQRFKIKKFGFKTLDLRYNYYDRSDGLKASIVSLSMKFTL